MKLDTNQQQRIETELGVEAIPEEHPVMPQLKEVFGDHTFFLGTDGLNIVEADPSPENTNGNVVRLANWSEDRSQLEGQNPEVLPMTVELGSEEPDSAG
jgi:hypothetical protein